MSEWGHSCASFQAVLTGGKSTGGIGRGNFVVESPAGKKERQKLELQEKKKAAKEAKEKERLATKEKEMAVAGEEEGAPSTPVDAGILCLGEERGDEKGSDKVDEDDTEQDDISSAASSGFLNDPSGEPSAEDITKLVLKKRKRQY